MNAAAALRDSLDYLSSPRAMARIRADPYWPKWDSPWWRMTLLWEMGLASEIPETAVKAMAGALKSAYLDFFPIRESELPPNTDPYREIACHCALGTMFQVLTACGIDVDEELPHWRRWFLKYQLPDGGLNCDESAYAKPAPKSSMISTLPPMEAVLLCTSRPFTPEEETFLDRGARYLIEHKLLRSTSGQVIDEEWLKPCVPLFYEYDVLRGVSFLLRWAKTRKKSLPPDAIQESMDHLRKTFSAGVKPLRTAHGTEPKTIAQDDSGAWVKGRPAELFPLLEEVSKVGAPSAYLERRWNLASRGV